MTLDPVSRRAFLATSAAAASAAMLTTRNAAAAPPPNWWAYHDADLATHTWNHGFLQGLGWRPVTLSVYGSPSDLRVAACWLNRPGPPWMASAAMNRDSLGQFFWLCILTGFRIVSIDATGSAADPRFAVIAEQGTPGLVAIDLQWEHSDEQKTLGYWIDWARENDLMIRSIALYGEGSDRRHAIAFEPNPNHVRWSFEADDSVSRLISRIGAQQFQRGRIAEYPIGPDGIYWSFFRDDQIIGGPTVCLDMSSQEYASRFDTLAQVGRFPIFVCGAGSASSPKFSAVFVESEGIVGRQFHVESAAGVTAPAIDSLIFGEMFNKAVRQATLAVMDGTRLVYAAGYTLAEPEHPHAMLDTHFRTGSCVKPLTAMLILHLIEKGLPVSKPLTLDTTLREALLITGAAKDARFDAIRIRHILNHTSGLDDAAIWKALPAKPPRTKDDYRLAARDANLLGRYDAPIKQPGGFTRTEETYSNVGYLLLGMVAEAVLGMPYIDALKSRIFAPFGVDQVRVIPPDTHGQPVDEAEYDSKLLDVAGSETGGNLTLVPAIYERIVDQLGDSTGGLTASAVHVMKVIGSLAVRTGNPVLNSASIDSMFNNGFGFDGTVSAAPREGWKGGEIKGASSTLHFREGGLSFYLVFNRDSAMAGIYPDFTALAAAVSASPLGADLFPALGVPAL